MADLIEAATAKIAQISATFLANGEHYTNHARPSTTHVRDASRWAVTPQREHANLETMICYASGAHENGLAAGKMPIPVAVVVALARQAFIQAGGTAADVASLSPVETVETEPLVVHATHVAAVREAIADHLEAAGRLIGVAYYNAISFALCGHHHMPSATRRLATTTITLLGLKDFFDEYDAASCEGIILHDMFHMVSMAWKSEAARSASAKRVCEALNLSNLAKRVPVKAPDTALVCNYDVLYQKARSFPKSGSGVPEDLAPTPSIRAKLAAYVAATPATVAGTVAALVDASARLAPASAYLGGYVLGKIRDRDGNSDMTLREAAKTTTILGSPALTRLAGEMPAIFTAGCLAGAETVKAADAEASVATLLLDAAVGVCEA